MNVRLSEDLLRPLEAMAEVLSDPVCLLSTRGELMYINAPFRSLSGYPSLEDLQAAGGLGAVLHEEQHSDGQPLASSDHKRVRLLSKSGKSIPLLQKTRLLPGDSNEPLALLYLFEAYSRTIDVTDYQKLLASFVNLANDAVMITEADPIDEPGPRIVFINQSFTRMTGYSKKESIGRSPRFLQGPKTQRQQLDKIRAALIAREVITVELINYRKNGEEFWVDFSVVPIPLYGGEITHFVSIQRETTQKKEIEQALMESRKRLEQALYENKQILNRSLDIICSLNEEGFFRQMNAACQRILGYAPEEMIGRHFIDFVYPADKEKTVEIAAAVGSGTILENFENRLLHKDGRVVTLSWNACLAEDNKSMYTTARDITALKEAQEQLHRYTAQLEKINSELDQFVYKTSHDLRAPLVSVLGLINLTQAESDQQQRNEYLNLMVKSIKKLDSFIQDIISFSKNARTEVVMEKIDFKALVHEVMDGLMYMEEAQDMEVSLAIDAVEEFYTDKRRLEVVLHNIISNAIRYQDPAKEKSYINIQISKQPGQWVQINVCDNGLGIAAEHQQKIFEMFYRATETAVGSGLGLYIVKESVEKLRGEISVQSEPRQGTCFSLRLPNLATQQSGEESSS